MIDAATESSRAELAEGETARVPDWRRVNGNQLAQLLGVSAQRVSALANAGLPRLSDKSYDLAAVVPWMIQRSLEKGDVAGSGSQRQLYYQAMTERAQLDTARLRGELYGREEVDQFLVGLVVTLREQVLTLPERVTRDRAIAAAVEREIYPFLEDAADAIAGFVTDVGPLEKSLAAATAKDRPAVGRAKTAPAKRRARPRKVSKG